jgi:hypothetical protein
MLEWMAITLFVVVVLLRLNCGLSEATRPARVAETGVSSRNVAFIPNHHTQYLFFSGDSTFSLEIDSVWSLPRAESLDSSESSHIVHASIRPE